MKRNVQATKLELIQWLSTLDNPKVLEQILAIRNTTKNDWWSETSSEIQQSIEQGVNDADSGKVHPHTEVRKLYGKWL
jgi:predicted transcriptional regulator